MNLRTTNPSLAVTVGPAPCEACHAPVYFVAGRWCDLFRGTYYRRFPAHICTAKQEPITVLRGRRARGGTLPFLRGRGAA